MNIISRKNFDLSLKRQISLWFSLLVFFIIFSVSLLILYFSKRVILDECRKQGLLIAKTFASQARRPLLTNHFSHFTFQLADIVEQEQILYAVVYDSQGVVRVHSNFEHIGERKGLDLVSRLMDEDLLVEERKEGGKRYYRIAVPVRFNGRLLGVAEIGYDLSDFYQTYHTYALLVLGIAVLGTVLGFFFCFKFADRITRPLLTLRNAAQSFASGNFDVQVDIHSGDEVGELALAFNRMARALKRTVRNLQSAYIFSNKIIASISDVLLVFDREGQIFKANLAATQIIGFSGIEIKKHYRFQDLLLDEDLPPRLEKDVEITNREALLLTREESVPVLYSLRYLGKRKDKDYFVFTGRVIKEIKEKEEQLRKEHERLIAILESLGEGVIVVNREGQIELVNPKTEEILGLDRKEILGKDLREVLHLVEEETSQPITVSLENLQDLCHRNLILRNTRGENLIVVLNAAPIRFVGKNRGWVIAILDVTEKSRLEREVMKAQKIEALGLLAGGIAHDFNNMLMGILGYINLSQIYCERQDKQKVATFLAKAEQAVKQARDLSQQLLTFAKGGVPLKEPLALPQFIREIANFVVRGSHIKVEFEVADDLWPVEADPSQISQVLNNLLINAIQAMPEGGVITIRARNVWLEEETSSLAPGRYVCLEVEDQGVGIPKRLLDRIFDPYFTTKEEGNGLGLAIVHSIIKKHGGHIEVFSEKGKGTKFVIYLPATEKKPRSKEGTRFKTIFPVGGRVLVLDDDEFVCEVVSEMLKGLGFEVVNVTNGEKMLELYRQALENGEPYLFVLTDLTLPGQKGGSEFARKLLEIDPHAIVIAMSGYANDPVMADPESFGFRAAVAKPFRLEDLRRVLTQVLGGQR